MGSSLCRSLRRGTPFQVQGVCRESALTRGRHCEESRVVALVLTFVKYIITNCFDICFCVKSVVWINGPYVVIFTRRWT